MGRYRIYPTKDNTLIQNTNWNTGDNEVMELWYGQGGITRHLIKFNTEEYNAHYDSGYVPHITSTTSTMHLFNCYPTFETNAEYGSVHASSVNIDVKTVQQDWDEGNGNDFIGSRREEGYSNWYSATSSSPWGLAGGDYVYTVFSGHIDKGHENFSGDITNEIALWDIITGTDHGLGVMYSVDHEILTGANKTVLKFFSKNANTYSKFVPYIQFDWDSQIRDERDEVITGSTKRIFLYLKKNGVFTNANSVSGVSFTFGQAGVTHTGYTGSSIVNPMPGFYYVDFLCPTEITSSTVFNDSWNVQYESGSLYSTVSQSGTADISPSYWDTSYDNLFGESEYKVSVPMLKEEVKHGERIYLEIKNYTNYTSNDNILKNMEYRIDLLDGNDKFEMVGWEGVSYTPTENFIILDTNWYHTGLTYSLSVKYNIDGSEIHKYNIKKFKVV